MAEVPGRAGDLGGNAPLVETICDSVFKNYLFWTLKDDDERIMKMLKTLPKPDESVIMERMGMNQKAELTDEKRSAWEVDWLNRTMTFRQKIINLVAKKRKLEGEVHTLCEDYAESQEDNVLAKWLGNGGNQSNTAYAWNLIKGLGGLDDPNVDLRQSVQSSLEKLFNARTEHTKHSLRSIQCGGRRRVYYIGDCKFRHMGSESRIPPRVHVTQNDKAAHTSVVRVFFSGSGTGKTVELATSSESRHAVITLMHEADGDIAAADPNDARTEQCRAYLKEWVNAFFTRDGVVLSTIVNTVRQRLDTLKKKKKKKKKERMSDSTGDDAHPKVKDNMIRIVLAIDEARKCPNFAKEIIRNYRHLGRDLGHYIMNKAIGSKKAEASPGDGELPVFDTLSAIEVVFSIAGTGMYGGTVGSQSNNFVCLIPSAQKDPKEVYEALRKEYHKGTWKRHKLPSYKEIMETPFLSVIVSHNARMASILVNQLAESVLKFGKPNDEMELVSLVFDKFARSNGMSELWEPSNFDELGSKRALAVARTLAILLYQTTFKVPLDIDLARKHAMALDYGINFEKFGDNDINIMQDLVTEYGLVTPVPFKIFDNIIVGDDGKNKVDPEFKDQEELEKPYIVDEAIQLFCVWLLEGGIRLKGGVGFLGTTPFAYEALSTQIIGAAITAAKTVSFKHRKCIQSIFKDTLGLKLKLSDGVLGDKIDHVTMAWDALKGVIPVSDESELAMDGMYYQQSEMNVNEPTIPTKPKNFESMTEAQVNKWMNKEVNKRLEAQKTRMRKNRWDKLKTKQVDPDFGSRRRKLISKWEKAKGFDASKFETLVPSFDMDIVLTDGLFKMREACGHLEKTIRKTEAPQFNPTKQNFCPSLTTVAEGSSNLADGYVSTAGVKKTTNSASNSSRWEVGFFTVCIQAKDYFDSSTIKYENIRKNRDRVYDSLLSITFGSNRLYCVASREDKLYLKKKYSGEAADGTSFYVGFPTDKSPLLGESMNKLDDCRRRSRKTNEKANRITNPQSLEDAEDIAAWIKSKCPWLRDYLDGLEAFRGRGGELDQKRKSAGDGSTRGRKRSKTDKS